MKNTLYAFSLFLSLIYTLHPTQGTAQTAMSSPTDAGWVELINGKDFTGWTASEFKKTWSITEGGIFQAVGKRSHLFYNGEALKDSFKNFEIDVWVKTYKLANSGICFHTAYQEIGWPSRGFEIQVNHSHIGEGTYIELKKMASLYGVRNLYKSFGKDDAWMNIKARVESNRVQIWLDGIKTVDYLQPDVTPSGVKRLSKGTFCLQGHDSLSKMQYKSFKVRRLPDDAHSDLTAPKLGVWHDSLVAFQGQQFAFIDLNPPTNLTAETLAQYCYQTGINTSLVKNVSDTEGLSAAKNFPLFTGIRVNALTINKLSANSADYVLGESNDLATAQALLSSGKINIWAHKNAVLTLKDANALLDLAVKNKVAIEIDNAAKTPSIEVLKLAKSKGCTFTFTGLIPANKLENSLYVIDAIRGAKLSYKDLFVPK